jgi:hypothetical protein
VLYSQLFIFFVTYKWAQRGRVLHLMGPLVSYEETEVLLILL